MQSIAVNQLLSQGFVEYRRTSDAVYMSRFGDHRIVLANGIVKRGQPKHRKRKD